MTFAIYWREVLHQAINPRGLGGFGVLVQGKGLSEAEKEEALKGLTIPPMMYDRINRNR
ncbi:hypothetical protein [Laspinema palackyanum]|uniref:hypothetical protein n=1 Tax=Laspinema palackyanum TaxID=3231601 RepID=UPI003F688326